MLKAWKLDKGSPTPTPSPRGRARRAPANSIAHRLLERDRGRPRPERHLPHGRRCLFLKALQGQRRPAGTKPRRHRSPAAAISATCLATPPILSAAAAALTGRRPLPCPSRAVAGRRARPEHYHQAATRLTDPSGAGASARIRPDSLAPWTAARGTNVEGPPSWRSRPTAVVLGLRLELTDQHPGRRRLLTYGVATEDSLWDVIDEVTGARKVNPPVSTRSAWLGELGDRHRLDSGSIADPRHGECPARHLLGAAR